MGGRELAAHTDWDEVTELLTESHCHVAPQTLVALVPATKADHMRSHERLSGLSCG